MKNKITALLMVLGSTSAFAGSISDAKKSQSADEQNKLVMDLNKSLKRVCGGNIKMTHDVGDCGHFFQTEAGYVFEEVTAALTELCRDAATKGVIESKISEIKVSCEKNPSKADFRIDGKKLIQGYSVIVEGSSSRTEAKRRADVKKIIEEKL